MEGTIAHVFLSSVGNQAVGIMFMNMVKYSLVINLATDMSKVSYSRVVT